MRDPVVGEYLAQVRNPDPFAIPAWRSPVYRTWPWLIMTVLAARLLWRLARFAVRHPLATVITAGLIAVRVYWGWPGVIALVCGPMVLLVVWRWRWPDSFTRFVARPARSHWRAWYYRRHWTAVMTIGKLAVPFQRRVLLPVLGKVTSTGCTDRVTVVLVSGQSPADVAARADNLAHGFGAILCRVRTAKPGTVILELVRRDALAAVIPALPIPAHADLRALQVGRREDGQPWAIRLHGTHLLIAGATGAGKASLLWWIVRALLPGLRPRTRELYAWLLSAHIVPYLGAIPLASITADTLREWRATLLSSGVSETAAAKAYRLLRAVLMTAAEDRIIPRNPCRIRGGGDEKPPERPVLTIAQVLDLADHIAAHRFRALILLATFASLRWGERSRSADPIWT